MQNNKRTKSSAAAFAVLSANIISKMLNLKKEGSSGQEFRPAYELIGDDEERLGRE